MLSALIDTWRSCAACYNNNRPPEATEYRSSRTRYSFHSVNHAPSRYQTNCLAYISRTLSLVLDNHQESWILEVSQRLFFFVVWTIPSPYVRENVRDRRLNRVILLTILSELTVPISFFFKKEKIEVSTGITFVIFPRGYHAIRFNSKTSPI